MTHHQFCGHSCESKMSAIGIYGNYLLGGSVLALLGKIIRSEMMEECQEGVGGDLPRPNQA